MEEPSEKVDPMKDPETPQKKDEEDALDDTGRPASAFLPGVLGSPPFSSRSASTRLVSLSPALTQWRTREFQAICCECKPKPEMMVKNIHLPRGENAGS
jgi:hypothetical protein